MIICTIEILNGYCDFTWLWLRLWFFLIFFFLFEFLITLSEITTQNLDNNCRKTYGAYLWIHVHKRMKSYCPHPRTPLHCDRGLIDIGPLWFHNVLQCNQVHNHNDNHWVHQYKTLHADKGWIHIHCIGSHTGFLYSLQRWEIIIQIIIRQTFYRFWLKDKFFSYHHQKYTRSS